jgi:hypothetical protein
MTYDIPQTEVQALTGLCKNALAMYFLSPNQIAKNIIALDGRTIQVKRPWHGDAEMRGVYVEYAA